GAPNGAPTSTGSPYASEPGQMAVYPENTGPSGSPYYGQPQQPAPSTEADPIKAEQKKRAYLSLFASNVALTYRKGEAAEKLAASPADPGLSALASETPSAASQAQALRDAEARAAMGLALPLNQPPQPRPDGSAP